MKLLLAFALLPGLTALSPMSKAAAHAGAASQHAAAADFAHAQHKSAMRAADLARPYAHRALANQNDQNGSPSQDEDMS